MLEINLDPFTTPFTQQFRFGLSWYDHAITYGLDYGSPTIRRLVYSSHLSATSSMSWSNNYRPLPQMLDNGLWTDKVRNLYDITGFSLTTDDRGRVFPGSFYACHAEKQLVAHYIDQHFF